MNWSRRGCESSQGKIFSQASPRLERVDATLCVIGDGNVSTASRPSRSDLTSYRKQLEEALPRVWLGAMRSW
jgi:hypothetical protein